MVWHFFQNHDTEALGEIYRRYYPKMLAIANRGLECKQIPEVVYQPDDALNSTMDRMLHLVLTGRVDSIDGVDGFWRLYRRILAWKISRACDRRDALKRGGTGIRTHPSGSNGDTTASTPSALLPADDFDLLQSHLLPAEVLAISNEVTERLINLLQPDLKSVVRMRLDGWTIAQMATVLGVSARSVDRMLDSIRRLWSSSGLLDGMPPRDRYGDGKP